MDDKGRYLDKQTTKLSFPLQPPVYRFDTKLTIDLYLFIQQAIEC